ncbi:uL15 family ribosomal protein [Candidatus Woesearchaeota archaeon]|nr:uL15 family ribosomal protein [Candidatus Woesearchaeota archaeon]
MTVNRRKKSSRMRGSHTHGWGSMKKHRGSGHKGGSGMAGTGKRADSKKPSIWKKDYFGRGGFRTHNKPEVVPVNVSYVEQHLEKFNAKEEGGKYIIDLNQAGYNKLLGTGKVTRKMVITVESASARAAESVKAAGGEVIAQKTASK